MSRQRKSRGNISFSTSLAFALVILGVGFLFLSMYMGGQRETKNAVDAGALNTGKKSLDDISVDLSGAENQQLFADCASDSIDPGSNFLKNQIGLGQITLRRINRVWAKAMTIAINADAAGGDAGSGTNNAKQAFEGAKDISDGLAAKLTDPSNLYPFFDEFSKKNSVRMIGNTADTQHLAGNNWQTSLLEREDESNIVLPGNPGNGFSMPARSGGGQYTLPADFATKCTRNPVPQGGGDFYFLKGYVPLTIGGNTFWQVPFQYDEKPHLVSKTTFEANQVAQKPIDWDKPVPNSFSAEGKAIPKSGQGETAMSWVLTNPHQAFTLSIPRSFMHIHLDDMHAYFYFFPTGYPPIKDPFQPEVTYDYTPSTAQGIPNFPGGILCSTVTPSEAYLGLEVTGEPLDNVIFGVPGGDTTDLETNMVNRINEMIGKAGPAKTASDLHSLLSDPATIAWMIAGERDFYVFSPDGENLTVQPKDVALIKAPWLYNIIDNEPDGNETEPVDDASTPGAVCPDPFGVIVTPEPFCSELFAFGWGTWDKDLHWTPGTGYNGCLGTVRVTRYTDVYSFGICNPL